MKRITSALILAVCLSNADAAEPDSLISFESSFLQSPDKLSAQWNKLSPEQRKDVVHFLVGPLGLSDTGGIQLIGIYRDTTKEELNQNQGSIFHFRQLDLLGSRLFWSVLVDPEDRSAQVFYHVDSKLVTGKPMLFGAAKRNEGK